MIDSQPIIAVTGASGFLGAAVCRALREKGFKVRALVRRPIQIPDADEVVQASLQISPHLMAALNGCQALIHCAGGGRAKSRSDFFQNNVETTEALLHAIQDCEFAPRSFILVSSISAAGGCSEKDHASTLDTCKARSIYGESKWQAEQALLRSALPLKKHILRLPALYGVGDDRMDMILRSVKKGWVPMPNPSQRLSLLEVDDAANAIVSLLQDGVPSPSVYYVEDGEKYDFRRVLHALKASGNPNAKIIPVPSALLWIVATVQEVMARLTRKPAHLTYDKVKDLTVASWICDSTSFRQDTGWKPMHNLESRCADLYREFERTKR